MNDRNLDKTHIHHSEHVQNEPGDILVVEFGGTILRNTFKPKTPDDVAKAEVIHFMELYRDKGGLRHQAMAAFQNLLNFSWLRRNNETYQRNRTLMFKTDEFEHHFKLPKNIELPAMNEIESVDGAVAQCIDFMETCLHQKNLDRSFTVRVEMLVGRGMNIFPSQPAEIQQKNAGVDDKKKHDQARTYRKGVNKHTGKRDIPLIDERQILYAFYTSDTSYSSDKSNLPPINVNPAGYVESEGAHYRDYKNGNCLYTIKET